MDLPVPASVLEGLQWPVYWLDYLAPSARHEQFGLVILAFGVFGFGSRILLERLAPYKSWARAYGLPAYLTSYISLIVGTLLVAHRPNILFWALLYDALLMVASTRVFYSALWLSLATAWTALAMLVVLNRADVSRSPALTRGLLDGCPGKVRQGRSRAIKSLHICENIPKVVVS